MSAPGKLYRSYREVQVSPRPFLATIRPDGQITLYIGTARVANVCYSCRDTIEIGQLFTAIFDVEPDSFVLYHHHHAPMVPIESSDEIIQIGEYRI